MTELLAPAGDFITAKIALYSGADAIYLAVNKFGARAYAKNLDFNELEKILKLAHSINKRIYVTVNTMIKQDELDDCINLVNTLYEYGVDGIICTDYSIICHIINNLPGLECHISTQSGVKSLEDALYFQKLGAKRVVLARENNINEIKNMKNNSNIELEVFAHGALCVSYSGGCLMSSLLSLRSGNRGRCSQNCRRSYKLYKNNTLVKDGFLLSMKDLNTFDNIKELSNYADSIKLEGRMKNPLYVKTITEEYRKKLDNFNYKTNSLDKVFHRKYTNGFLFNEDKGNIVDYTSSSNEGKLIGNVIKKENNYYKLKINESLNIGDRIRFESDIDKYITIDKMYNEKLKEINSGSGIIYLELHFSINNNSKIYKMIDSSLDIKTTNEFKKGIDINVYGSLNNKLTISTTIDGNYFYGESEANLIEAKSRPIDYDTLYNQLSKLNDTSFYLNELNNSLDDNLFITIKEINTARRDLIEKIESFYQNKRKINYNENIDKINYEFEENTLTAFCTNVDQYNALKELGIKYIYFNNYISYSNPKYKDIDEDYVLISNYGCINKYKNKEMISDYSFNVANAKAIYELHKSGIKYITPSVELSYIELKELYESYKKYGNNPNLEIIVYGKQNLMTIKYCPLKSLGECTKCNDSKYYLKDEVAKFPIYHEGCITHIINDKALNLIDELNNINQFTNRFRLNFTNESYEETIKITKMFIDKLNNINEKTDLFDSKNNTRGYYKRKIL